MPKPDNPKPPKPKPGKGRHDSDEERLARDPDEQDPDEEGPDGDEPDDEPDDEDTDGGETGPGPGGPGGPPAEGPLEPINRAVAARKNGQEPEPGDLNACRRFASQNTEKQLLCWNGRRPDRPECKPAGSQNIPFYARCGIADWKWVAALCRVEKEEGNFGRENGSDASYYYSGIVSCKRLARRELLKLGLNDDARDVRLAIRSNLAWDAMAAIPARRQRDIINEAGTERTLEAKKAKLKITVAVSGNRYTVKERARATGLSSDNAHSRTLAAELESTDGLGLKEEEIELVKRVIDGDVEAARTVSGWMFGTIETPNNKWRWRLRRTTEGSESIFFGPFPNPNKPVRTVAQAHLDGTYRVMKPSPRGVRRGFASGYQVDLLDGGQIRALSNIGEASLPQLGGDLLWQVDIVGSEVKFTTG